MEPTSFTSLITEQVKRLDPSSRPYRLRQAILRAHQTNQDRRAAVLRHPDLATRLVHDLGYAYPEQWNGYIPPAQWPLDDDGELLRQERKVTGGQSLVHFNEHGRRSCGTKDNDAPERAILLELSGEAWRREHELPELPELPAG